MWIKKLKFRYFQQFHMYVCVSGGKKCSFFEQFSVLCLLETPILWYALLPYYRLITITIIIIIIVSTAAIVYLLTRTMAFFLANINDKTDFVSS